MKELGGHAAFGALRGVFTDIDDTLTTDGRLTPAAYAALGDLHDSGRLVIPVTGRPAGWCDHIARMWPVDAVVGENGAFYFRYRRDLRTMERWYVQDADERRANRARLARLGQQIVERHPGMSIAADQSYREVDLAVDFREDRDAPDLNEVAEVVSLFEAAGATAKVSSIHVNGWFGVFDKLTTTRRMMSDAFGIDLDVKNHEFAFIGDSPNDQPMFRYFKHSVGVANVRDFQNEISDLPRYVTRGHSGDGFVEFVSAILEESKPKSN